MSITDAAPLKKLDLNLDSAQIFKTFSHNVDKMKLLLETNPRFDDIISAFQDPRSPTFNSLSRAINLLKNATNLRKFTLVPLIARYNQDSEKIHHLRNLLLNNNEIKIVFVEPIFEVEGVIYAYRLYIPVPKDMMFLDDPQDLLREHWNMVSESLPRIMRSTLVKRFIPLYTIGRVYGWDASYLAYSVAVKDDGNFWSLPLVNSPFNGIQPFLATMDGEFAIIERDETESSKEKTMNVLKGIAQRASGNPYITLEEGKSIAIPPELFAANIDYSNPHINLEIATKDLGGKLGPISIDRNLPSTTKKLFELMQAQTFGTPQYIFSESEREKFQIINK